jgi:hypothetical protein
LSTMVEPSRAMAGENVYLRGNGFRYSINLNAMQLGINSAEGD